MGRGGRFAFRDLRVRPAPLLALPPCRGLDPATARDALEFLVGGLLDHEQRAGAYSRMLRLLARAYGDQGPLPGWVRALLERDTGEGNGGGAP